jgi:uncharacterized protein YjdB
VIATSMSDPSVKDSIQVLVNLGSIRVTKLVVSTQGGVSPIIDSISGMLQMIATITPSNASNQAVIWSVVSTSGNAIISQSGLVKAISNGKVWAKAVSASDSSIKDSIEITINLGSIPVTGIIVSTANNIPPFIRDSFGILKMTAQIFPLNASNQSVIWSVIPISGNALVDASGNVTAFSDGLIWVKAMSVSNPAVMDSVLVSISQQFIKAMSLVVVTSSGMAAVINTIEGTLQLQAILTPVNTSDKNVTWSINSITGNATISNSGLVTAKAAGLVWAKAVLNANPTISDSIQIIINNRQIIDSSNAGINIYPNPSTGKFTIQSKESHPAMIMAMYDASGRKIIQWEFPKDRLLNSFEVDLSYLPAGTYFLQSNTGKELKNAKWIKL